MNKLILRGIGSAGATALYVMVLAWFIDTISHWFWVQPNPWFRFSFMLIIFIVSACVTASLVLLKPILLYLEGRKKEAVHLFGYTVAALAVITLLVGLGLYITNRAYTPVYCAQDAKLCPDGSYVGRSGPNCQFKCPGE